MVYLDRFGCNFKGMARQHQIKLNSTNKPSVLCLSGSIPGLCFYMVTGDKRSIQAAEIL